MISDVCDTDKKIFVISIYTNEKNIKNDINEETVQAFFGRYMLNNYEILTVDIDSQDDFSNKIDKITKVMLQEKNLITSDIKDLDNDKSKSLCLIY